MSSDLQIWNDAAGAWSNKVTKEGSLRSAHLHSAVQELMGDASGKAVLDAGTGDGVFANYLKSQGARVTGVDGAEEMVKIAKGKYPDINFAVADLLKPMPVGNQSFDVVLANMLLMHLSQINTFLSESNRVLKNSGLLIFSVLHPCFNYPTMRLYKSLADKLLGRKPSGLSYNYYQDGVSRRFESTMGKELTHYHRTLEQYSSELAANGFVIQRMLEPHTLTGEFLKNNPKLEYTTRLPRFLFYKCLKHA